MATKGRPAPLQDLVRERTCKLTLDALSNILRQERESEEYHRKLRCRGKRKRAHSCDGCPVSKKAKTEEHQHVYYTRARAKREREQEHDEDVDAPRKRRKSFGPSHGGASSHTSSPPPGHLQGSRDDLTLQQGVFDSDKLEALRRCFCYLTPSMWTTYARCLLDRVISEIRFKEMDQEVLGKTIEYIFGAKLLSFSTVAIERYSCSVVKVLFDQLMKCTRLEVLEVTVPPSSKRDVAAAALSLQTLGRLHSLSLLPSSRVSYHWAVSHLARHCYALRELKIVYNGDLFNRSDELASLGRCGKLASLWLFNFGHNSEMREVIHLLESLGNLEVLYHKELPNAILELRPPRDAGAGAMKAGAGRHLGLQRVDLCWHERAIGYQLVYVPASHLLHLARMCPHIRVLNLVGPPCLAEVIGHLPSLHVLILHQASLTLCLGSALKHLDLARITELRVSDVWDVTHDVISAVACGCPHLQVLNVINANLEARGDLQALTHRPPFPHLRQLTLVFGMINRRPPLTTPSVWQLGAQLTSYFLDGASQLTDLWLYYQEEDILDGDLPTAQYLDDVLTRPRPALRSLRLEWPPAVSPGLVGAVVRACPALATLSSIITWPLTSDQRATFVALYGRCVDIM
ncbi:uncharacterized protein LOC135102069 [Scylla paramamosain]|uniref:uncharacterized protein LOC135102069 n=1 Tax=Scylla paramamosain TaxID=85552 RepID=UPI003082F41A